MKSLFLLLLVGAISLTASIRAQTPTNPVKPYDQSAEVAREKKTLDLLLLTPITFYGKVVDTESNPVARADVSMSAANHIWGGNSKDEEITDTNGVFSIHTHGLGLVVMVSKRGYYKLDKSDGSFGYSASAGPMDTHKERDNPAIFVLKKRGVAEPLVVKQVTILTPGDGSPRELKLSTGRSGEITNGDVILTSWIEDQGVPVNSNKPYNWRCQITVPGGGIQPRNGGEFDFIAPADGYQTNAEMNMRATADKWRADATQSYFIKTGSGYYARIDLNTIAGGDKFFVVKSFFNPQPGHRNLEYDPDLPSPAPQ